MTSGRTDQDPDRELAEAKVADAADARRSRRRQRELRAEEATVRAVLAGLLDAAWPVVLATADGRRITGTIVGLGVDVVIVDGSAGRTTALRTASVVSVEAPGLSGTGGVSDEPSGSGQTIADLLAGLVGSRRAVSLQLTGSASVEGEVDGVGVDVVIVAAGGQTIYVALDSVNGFTWTSSSDG